MMNDRSPATTSAGATHHRSVRRVRSVSRARCLTGASSVVWVIGGGLHLQCFGRGPGGRGESGRGSGAVRPGGQRPGESEVAHVFSYVIATYVTRKIQAGTGGV